MQGEQLNERLAVPRLRVRKDWHQGLADDPISHDRPDAGDKPDAELGFVGAGKASCCRLCVVLGYDFDVSGGVCPEFRV